jgi:hypothetical protein
MKEVSFEWADGPCANYATCGLRVYSPSGEKIDYRSQTVQFHKNGKWSYSDLKIFVPEGSVVIEMRQNTHGYRTQKIWKAVEGRPMLLSFSGKWGQAFTTWPEAPEGIEPDIWRKILGLHVVDKVKEEWDRNASVQAI